MHFVKAKGILSSGVGMNIYRGCQHGCVYCDARSCCYQFEHLFEDIEVKENALELLESGLKSKRHACMLGTGTMSDPYMPLERKLGMTRGMLELLDKYGFDNFLLNSDISNKPSDPLSVAKTVRELTRLGYSEKDIEKVSHKNAEKFFKI